LRRETSAAVLSQTYTWRMRKWLPPAALVTASLACLVVAVVKYEASRGTYGAYMDGAGHVTVPGLPHPAPWLWTAIGLLVLSAIAAKAVNRSPR
jgi:hypothetical protein